MPADRVLSLSMRPKFLDDLVGQESVINPLIKQFKSNRIPHFFIISGPVGAGKTTLARIIALNLQTPRKRFDQLSETDWFNYSHLDIKEINAANKTGVDDMRALINSMKYKPLAPSKCKIVILDEAHQLSKSAQQVLITETEDVAEHVYYIFCTSEVEKIIPALKRRASLITPKALSKEKIKNLLETVQKKISTPEKEIKLNPLVDALSLNNVYAPGLVLQAADRYFSGMSAEESVTFADTDSKLDSRALCQAVASANWTNCASILQTIEKNDIYGCKMQIIGYLKAILLKSMGSKAVGISKAIKIISSLENTGCVPSFLADICMACDVMKVKAVSTKPSTTKT